MTIRRVLITGGAAGIGRAIVEAFATQGDRVVFTHLHTAPDETLASVRNLAGEVTAISADLTDEIQADVAMERAIGAMGHVDVVVANTGGMVHMARCVDMSLSTWNAIMAVNATSTFLTCRAALRHMEPRRAGAIVVISSLAGHNGGGPLATAYGAAKGAMITYTRGLAKEVGPLGIRVNGVAPGIITGRLHDTFTPDQSRQNSVAATPLRREGSAEDVAEAVLFLASTKAGFISGETIEVNGGYGLY